MGPRLSAGKKVSAPRIKITLMSKTVKREPFTGKVPGEGGTLFFVARLPARASTGIIMRKRPPSMAQPMAVSYHQSVVGLTPALSPAKADPLLPTAEV